MDEDLNTTSSSEGVTPKGERTANTATGSNSQREDSKEDPRVLELKSEAKRRRLENQTLQQQIQEMQTKQNELLANIAQAAGIKSEGGLDPAQTIDALGQELSARDSELEFVEAAIELGITARADRKYFQYLIDEAMEDKEDGEELTGEEVQAIVQEVKGRSKSQGGSQTSTSFSDGMNAKPGGSNNSSEITLEKFKAMGTVEKGQLYNQNPQLYANLQAQAMPRRKQGF